MGRHAHDAVARSGGREVTAEPSVEGGGLSAQVLAAVQADHGAARAG